MANQSNLRSFADAVKITGVSDVTLRRHAKNKRIHTVPIGRRVLIPQTEIDRICREGIKVNDPVEATA